MLAVIARPVAVADQTTLVVGRGDAVPSLDGSRGPSVARGDFDGPVVDAAPIGMAFDVPVPVGLAIAKLRVASLQLPGAQRFLLLAFLQLLTRHRPLVLQTIAGGAFAGGGLPGGASIAEAVAGSVGTAFGAALEGGAARVGVLATLGLRRTDSPLGLPRHVALTLHRALHAASCGVALGGLFPASLALASLARLLFLLLSVVALAFARDGGRREGNRQHDAKGGEHGLVAVVGEWHRWAPMWRGTDSDWHPLDFIRS
ncbi:hypothetical protein [Luteimonas vadosa]|uniref:hypothetical protein n=1 Tax=Luteimonas vadosa TaxID=1165507 RepID=UPI0031E574F3